MIAGHIAVRRAEVQNFEIKCILQAKLRLFHLFLRVCVCEVLNVSVCLDCSNVKEVLALKTIERLESLGHNARFHHGKHCRDRG